MAGNIVKKAITDSFVSLLEKKPLDRISVTEIASLCGVSRRTFYNYFEDVYQLAEEMLYSVTLRITDSAEGGFESGYSRLLEFAYLNKKFVLHLYGATDRDMLEQYVFGAVTKSICDSMSCMPNYSSLVREDTDKIALFFAGAVVSMTMDWVRRGMKEEPSGMVDIYSRLLNGTIQRAMENCERK